jgi:Transmembrane secretion effector
MVDLSPLRASRDLRLLTVGEFVSGLGTQAALVALPYQLYTQTGSAFLTGLLGAVELAPLITAALLGGAIADRMDRRRVLLLDQSRSSPARARSRRWPSPARRRWWCSTSSAGSWPAQAACRT